MALPSAYAQYNNSKVLTASPAELTLMLYDGAIKFCNIAEAAVEKNDVSRAHENIRKVQNIIGYLHSTLDMKYEVSKDFDNIYSYLENQLTILSESLDKKLEVLQKIQDYNKRQEEVFSAPKVDMSLFDDAVEEKQRLIDEVVRLDEGFEILYEKLAKELEGNRERYAVQIKELQAKVAKVTELGVSVQAQEARNKKLIENYFTKERAGIGQRRKNAKTAYDYYKSMSGAGYVQPQMYDNKK